MTPPRHRPPVRQRVAFAANPRSGAGRGRHAAEVALPILAGAADVEDVTGADAAATASALAGAVRAGVDAVVVSGGDGMVNLAVNAVAATGTPLGIVPAGTGNDIARELGLPLAVQDAAAVVLRALDDGSRRRVDAARCLLDGGGVRWFAGVLGAGFDAVVNERANGWAWPRGSAKYTLAIVRELPVYHERHYLLDLDGQQVEARAMLVAVANGPAYGGGMRISPRSSMEDGLLDVVVAGPISRFELLRIFPKVFSGRHVDHPRVRLYRAACVRIDSPGMVGYADGERFGPLPLTSEAMPGALTLLA
jgi:diacylglycerol kinase (ATP)